MHILLDQDGVLADFERRVERLLVERYDGIQIVPPERRRVFEMKDDYPADVRPIIESIFCEPGFFASLDPVPGSIEAVTALIKLGHKLTVCTSPLTSNPTCMNDKFAWLYEYFGRDLARGMVVSKDKTLIRGDILIDDKPEVTGAYEPTWELVYYDSPYNRHITRRRRLTWFNWREVLKL